MFQYANVVRTQCVRHLWEFQEKVAKMAGVTPNAAKVLTGFSRLSYEERKEVIDAINDYQKDTDAQRRKSVVDSFRTKAGVPIGPIATGGCPCCGK